MAAGICIGILLPDLVNFGGVAPIILHSAKTGETKTIAISIYDRVQAFDYQAAAVMAATLLAITLVALGVTNTLVRRIGRHND